MSNDITALRAELFETLRAVKGGTMEIERAKAISDISQTIINSVKSEVDYIRATGEAVNTSFIPVLGIKPVPEAAEVRQIKSGVVTTQGNVTRHVMK